VYNYLRSEFQTVTAGKYKRTLTPTKKVTKEDIDKQKEDLEDILVLFKDFVKQNRPTLNIDSVATGETWFGEDALKMGLCDEIRTVDDVLSEYVDSGYDVYQVRYDPTPTLPEGLGRLLPIGKVSSNSEPKVPRSRKGSANGGLISSFVRWFVSIARDELAADLGDLGDARYKFMAEDDVSHRIRVEELY